MAKRHYPISKEMLLRCKIVDLTPKVRTQVTRIKMEHFHFFYDAPSIEFSLYLCTGDRLVEAIQPHELSEERLDTLAAALLPKFDDTAIVVRNGDLARYYSSLNAVRRRKIVSLKDQGAGLDEATLELFTELSMVSQMLVCDGLREDVIDRARLAATHLVKGLRDAAVMLTTLTRIIQFDPTLYDHSALVSMVSALIGSRLLAKAMSEEDTINLALGGLVHDIGKTAPPSAILHQPRRLIPAEIDTTKTQSLAGYDELTAAIAGGAILAADVARAALEYQERFSGEGVPYQKIGRFEEQPDRGIHIFGRIVAIAAAFLGLLRKRPYMPGCLPVDAIKIMRDSAKDFDSAIFIPFAEIITSSHRNEKVKKGREGNILIIEDGKITKVG